MRQQGHGREGGSAAALRVSTEKVQALHDALDEHLRSAVLLVRLAVC